MKYGENLSNVEYYLGIDPGQNGGIVALNLSAQIVSAFSFITDKERWPHQLALYLGMFNPIASYVCIESVHAMPKQGVTSTFTFGKNFGMALGILVAKGFEYNLIIPRVWSKAMCLTSELDPKERAVKAAHALFGKEPFIRSKRCTKPDQALVDASLIAEYGRRMHRERPFV